MYQQLNFVKVDLDGLITSQQLEEVSKVLFSFTVENATYYEVSVWRMSTSNASLMLERRGSMGYGMSQALSQGEGVPWLVRGTLGNLRSEDEVGASACNRYGCSGSLLLRPTEMLLNSASVPWWKCKSFGS